ncbi:hypothetical protein V6N13_099674 [Hibiscus sabdariffa]
MSEPNYTLRSLQHDVLHEFGTLVLPRKCGRARDMTLEMIEGNHKAQYGRIYDYLQELRITNHGTTTICYLDLRLFQRMYVCPQACKEGWKVGCMRIIGVYSFFLKGYFQEYLLSAVGIDANDCIYLIAYAEVESLFQWDPVTDMEPILPPIIRRPLGRPVKKRKLEPDEVSNPKLSKRRQ